jgi:hemoglobin-like flavoprotein
MTTSVTLMEYQASDDDIVALAVSTAIIDTSKTALPESVSWRVTRSWELVSSKLEKVGIDFFLRVFEERPDMLQFFHFGGVDITRQNMPPALRNHAMKVMKAIGFCVSGLAALDSLIPTLRSLGEVHMTAGVLEEHYEIIFNHLMDAIAAELGPEEWDADTRDGKWCTCYGLIDEKDSFLTVDTLHSSLGVGLPIADSCHETPE